MASKVTPHASYAGTKANAPLVHTFFDKQSATWTYVVVDPATRSCYVIDPVLDYDAGSGQVSFTTVEALKSFIEAEGLRVDRIIETHVHADHLTGAMALKRILPSHPPIYVGSRVDKPQAHFSPMYGFSHADLQGSFDGHLVDNEKLKLGELDVTFLPLPGHTPDSMGILVGDALFAGDSLFMPDVGTARVDFPGGSAKALYESVQSVFSLDPDVRVFAGHDYPDGREVASMSTVAEQMARNKHVGAGATMDEFVRVREARDATLASPRLLHPSLQVNLRAGRLPPADEHGRQALKTPVRLPDNHPLTGV
ncbi:hypothetical protein Q8F55_006061 [Vanrija albida]|uniref:Metallo-beta-lactamase domain-containing protein n=1 Tax=Vanrija albida TaxID=181172 RepID=A0ABR3Q3J8_9TREE